MKIQFDDNANAVYLNLDETAQVVDSEEVKPGLIIDYNSKNEIVGIEILNVKQRIAADKLKQILVEVA